MQNPDGTAPQRQPPPKDLTDRIVHAMMTPVLLVFLLLMGISRSKWMDNLNGKIIPLLLIAAVLVGIGLASCHGLNPHKVMAPYAH